LRSVVTRVGGKTSAAGRPGSRLSDVYFFHEEAETDERYPGAIPGDFWYEAEWAIINHEVMPSMRALMTAGPALDRSHVAGYNCSFIPLDSPRAFDEALYILMNGTGLGFLR
jgi:ribonucleoside-triphosphate reductase